MDEDITREDIRILNTIDAAHAGEKQEEKDEMRKTAEAMREIASRPTTQNHFDRDSCHFEMGSSMNGNLIMNPMNEQRQ